MSGRPFTFSCESSGYARDRIVPQYLDASDPGWHETAERLLELFRGQESKTRGELEDDLREVFGNDPTQLIHQGLAKLLEDRCEFEVVAGHPPEQVREAVFAAAAKQRGMRSAELGARNGFDRTVVLGEVASALGLAPETVEQGMFADLKSEQRLVRFKNITAERLLQRYNVGLAQAVLLRSTKVHVTIRGEPPQRYRQLLRFVKFHRLVCEMEKTEPDSYQLHLFSRIASPFGSGDPSKRLAGFTRNCTFSSVSHHLRVNYKL